MQIIIVDTFIFFTHILNSPPLMKDFQILLPKLTKCHIRDNLAVKSKIGLLSLLHVQNELKISMSNYN